MKRGTKNFLNYFLGGMYMLMKGTPEWLEEYFPVVEVKKVSLEELYQECDIISLHCPLTDKTRHMINRESISEMKEGVILINTGRGPLVDEKDVAEALKDGKIGAFCADVLSTEPPSEHNPLISAPNVYITPHIAWATKEARSRLMKIAVDNLKSFLEGHPVNVVS